MPHVFSFGGDSTHQKWHESGGKRKTKERMRRIIWGLFVAHDTLEKMSPCITSLCRLKRTKKKIEAFGVNMNLLKMYKYL